MADGGVSSLIVLIAGLLVSGAASVTLIDMWSATTDVAEMEALQRVADSETSFALAGDPLNVNFDDGGTNEITFYLQNVGVRTLENSAGTSFGVFIDGSIIDVADLTLTMVGGATDWVTGSMLKVVADASGLGLSDGDDVRLTITIQSDSGNPLGTASIYEVVRLV